ncbi:MAG: acetylxylan esterase [Planctomycetota bacterium]|nr:acetylxylan esterase [Planctomycetota bacterium]
MWYSDTSQETWVIRHAACDTDTAKWTIGDWKATPGIILKADQPWESGSLRSPIVLKVNDIYQMWYVADVKNGEGATALGFAVSADGLQWHKHPQNPVFHPGAGRGISAPTVKRMPGGEFRIWYADRGATDPEYQCSSIKSIRWDPQAPLPIAAVTSCPDNPEEFIKWRDEKRAAIVKMLGIPKERVPLNPEKRGQYEQDGVVIERWILTTEPGSRAPALLYRPKVPRGKMPAIVMTFGHGDSKSAWYCQYAAQVYARLGLACLAVDPIGSEERHPAGVRAIGARGHDKPYSLIERSEALERRIMGKLVLDFIRGIDFLEQRSDIDRDRVGVAGNSLGGAEATWLSIVEPRIKVAVVSGWGYTENLLYSGKDCTRLPNTWLRERMSWLDVMLLSAPDCDVFFVNGAEDFHYVLSWDYLARLASESSKILKKLGMAPNTFTWTEPEATHRPFHIHKEVLRWIHNRLGTPNMTLKEIEALPVVIGGAWCNANGFRIEGFYSSVKSQTGCRLPDLGLRRIPQKELLCLKPGELGRPEFTIDGWLRHVQSTKQ